MYSDCPNLFARDGDAPTTSRLNACVGGGTLENFSTGLKLIMTSDGPPAIALLEKLRWKGDSSPEFVHFIVDFNSNTLITPDVRESGAIYRY